MNTWRPGEYIDVIKALGEFQEKVKHIPLNKTNPFHKNKYADLTSILPIIRPTLRECGLTVFQPTDTDDSGNPVIHTVLSHISGQSIVSSLAMTPDKLNPQGIGAALTYGRRYALCSLLGIVADEDDDGNAASGVKSSQKKTEKREDDSTFDFDRYKADIDQAQDMEKLKFVGVQIKGQESLSQEIKERLKPIYTAREKELKEGL